MNTIPQITKQIISNKPFLSEMISSDLVNLTALARNIREEIEKETLEAVSLGSVIMALKRYKDENENRKLDIVGSGVQIEKIMVISDLVEFTFNNISKSGEKQKKLSELTSSNGLSFLSYIKGMYELTIISNKKYEKEIYKIYADDTKVGHAKSMSALIMQLPLGNLETSGLYYYIFKQLAWDGIPISEVISTQNELIILIKDIYIDKAFSLINKLRTKN